MRGGHIGPLSSRAPPPEQERHAQATVPMQVEEAGEGPGAAGAGAAVFRVLGRLGQLLGSIRRNTPGLRARFDPNPVRP